MPTSWPAQPPCRTSATTPYAAATDSRFITAAFTATAIDRNATQQQQHRQQHHAADEQRDPLGDVVGAVDRGRGDAADVDGRRPVPAVALGQHVVAQRVDQVLGRRVLRSGGRDDGDHRGVAVRVEGRRASTAATPPVSATASGDLARGASADRRAAARRPAAADRSCRRRSRRPACRRPAGCVVSSRLLPASGKPNRTPRNGAGERQQDARRRRSRPRRGGARPSGSSRARPRDGSTCPPSATDDRRDRARAAAGAGRRACPGSPAAPGTA